MPWSLHDAEQGFSQLVDRARDEGPQVVTRHGREVAVGLGVEEYRRLTGGDAKDALRAFAETADQEYDDALASIVADRGRSLPRDLDLPS